MKSGSSLGKYEETSEGQDFMSCSADDDFVCFWDCNVIGVSHNSTFFQLFDWFSQNVLQTLGH